MKSFYFALLFALIIYANQAYGSEAGMPQLNPEFWVSQIFWLVLVFSSLYIMVWKIFLPKITYSIENRKSKVVNDLSEAQKIKDKAEKKLKDYNEIIENSKKEAKRIIEKSKKELDEDIENKKKKFNNEIENELKIVEKEIKDLKKSSITQISNIAAEVAGEVVKRLIDTEVNKSNVSAIVDEIIKKKMDKHI